MPENKKDFVPSMNPEEMPTLQDYMSKDRESRMTRRNTKTCKNCGKVFTNTEELAAHYKITLHPHRWITSSFIVWLDAHP
jgi:hypothetical protein